MNELGMKIIKDIIVDGKLKKVESNSIYNFLDESDSARYYDELFSEAPKKQNELELYDQVRQLLDKEQNAYGIMEEIIRFLEQQLDREAIVIEIGGGVYQGRSVNAYSRFNNYFPLDISYSNIRRYCETFNKLGFVGDATALPFKDNSIDCIFTHTFLEHPLEPQKVLSEISRVLKIGGIVVHNDAWFCRWWQGYGFIGLKKYESMTKKEKMIHIVAKISEMKVLRIPPIILKRLFKDIFQSKKKPINLAYKKLQPNYELYLGCDEDAATSIDPIDVVRFYESRNFDLVNQLSFTQRLFYPNKYIILKKN
jgi:SAM-dependent methyltransferase